MKISYEGANFNVNLKDSMEKQLIKEWIKKKIGKSLGKPYQKDPYLKLAENCLNIKEKPVVCDVGANIGTTIIPLAKKFPLGTFFAIEPHPLPGSRFLKNQRLNALHNLHLITAAIGKIILSQISILVSIIVADTV